MNKQLRERVEGLARKVGGTFEKAAGKVLGNEAMVESGHARESEGRAQLDSAEGEGGHVDANEIQPDMPVVCSDGDQFAVVDHMEGADSIKLKKDDTGYHHFIPLNWVTKVDGRVHVDRPGAQAMEDWSTEASP